MFVINKKSSIIISLILGLCLINSASNANDLNKVDIKRSNTSSSTLNVTIYTANPYDENVAVTKKADDKYVILMPNISGVNASNIDYSAIKDIVSDVSLKSVDDAANGYTKITLTTTKPVTITTSTKKSTPLTEEQKAYKNLIAQAKGYAAQATATQPQTTQAKPVQVVPQTQPDKQVSGNVQQTKSKNNAQEKNILLSSVPIDPVIKKEVKTESKQKLVDKNQADAKNTAQKTKTTAPIAPTTNISFEEETKQILQTTQNNVNDINAENTASEQVLQEPAAESTNISNEQNLSKNIQTQDVIPQTRSNEGTEKNMLTTVIILLSSILGLMAFFKGIKSSLEGSVVLKKSFKDNLHEKPHEPVADYSDIASDKTLSWQEKYQKYVNSVIEINPEDGVLRHVGNGEYEFVNSSEIESIYKDNSYEVGYGEVVNAAGGAAQLQPKSEPKFKVYNKPAMNSSPSDLPPIKKVKNQSLNADSAPKLKLVENDSEFTSYKDLAESLERTLHESPDVERISIDEEALLKQMDFEIGTPKDGSAIVQKEEDAISNSIRKAPKLKSFANKLALEETRRYSPSPKYHSDIIKSKGIESKYVNLENSRLYSSGRTFENANLSSADLITRNKIKSNRAMTSSVKSSTGKTGKYTTISVDEFFDSIDSSSKITASATLASRVADRLTAISNSSEKAETKAPNVANPLEGKVIKAGYNIDETSGFYIITDKEGHCSLIGKANNEVTVLKDFSHFVDAKLQVRKDGDNVYIVKAAGERYLVEVNGSKMGVLIEL